ncbi:adenine deaminase [Bacillus glycinifermentans]|uniref:adenine deaminase n=2 Tax=Bacillaceae TaxID=186817 RepID=UPI0015817A8D|nr:adenine deaminase [Bacillus glycinifermentans]MBU8788236.1 adenine deaminase [Bacillus glycinifermentans]NUJ18444.1 adenine deaminase [Bacillus glycinifermentans]
MEKQMFIHRLGAAGHRRKADIVIKNGKIMDVFNQEWIEQDIAITDGAIVGLGDYEGEEVIDAEGQMIVPGFIDGHVHIESSMVTPPEFAKAVIPHGVTTVITDPHEIANVSGVKGLHFMMEQARLTPLNIYFMLPSCVPAAAFEKSGAALYADDLKPFYSREDVLGLAEVMDYVSVESLAADMTQKLFDAQAAGKRIDGHLAGLTAKYVNIYRAAGVLTDHEVTTPEEALERIRRGMYVMLREGSVAKNVCSVLPAVNEKNARRFFFCTDDKHLDELIDEGSINHQVKLAILSGLDPFLAYQMGSLNAAECYGLKTKGAVAPGYDADLLFISDLKNVRITKTMINGKVYSGLNEADAAASKPEPALLETVHLPDLQAEDLRIPLVRDKDVRIIEIIPNQLETKLVIAKPKDGAFFRADPERDLLKIAVIERHRGIKEIGLGIVKGFGLKEGAIAATISHDSHNFIAVGTNDEDMMKAAGILGKIGGGLTVAKGGKELHSVALPIAGLLSDKPLEEVNKSLKSLHGALKQTGFSGSFNPFLTLSFLALPVIPDVKMTTEGLFDVKAFTHISVQ